jgi:SAM-dependent methyltransferase
MAEQDAHQDRCRAHHSKTDHFDQDLVWNIEHYQANEAQRLRGRLTAAMLDPEVGSVLDVGCSSGFITRQLRSRGPIVGLDRSAPALAMFEGDAVLGSIDALPFGDRAFEAVVCNEVLEHLSPPVFEQAAGELARVTERHLVLSVPYREHLDNDMTQCRDCGRRYNIHGHRRTFSGPEALARRFPGFGLDARCVFGRKLETKSALFRLARRLLLGSPASLPEAVCPHCGSGNNASYRDLGRSGLTRRVIEGLEWRLPKVALPVWMIVKLRRAEDSPDAVSSGA